MIAGLWRRRACFPVGSRRWARAWAKRLLTLPALTAMAVRIMKLRGRRGEIGADVAISALHCVGSGRLSIGEGSAIGVVELQLHAPVTVGRCVTINDGVRILTGTHALESADWELVRAPVQVGDFAWVATGAILLPGAVVGEGAVVAAGAVVHGAVAPWTVVAGNPARPVKQRTPRPLNHVPGQHYACVSAWLRG